MISVLKYPYYEFKIYKTANVTAFITNDAA